MNDPIDNPSVDIDDESDPTTDPPVAAPPAPREPVQAKPLMPPGVGERAEEAAPRKKSRRPYNPGFGGGWGQVFILVVFGGAVGLGYTLDINLPGLDSADAADTADTPQPEPARPDKTDPANPDYRPDFDPDNPFALPDPDKQDKKDGTFFGIPTNE